MINFFLACPASPSSRWLSGSLGLDYICKATIGEYPF